MEKKKVKENSSSRRKKERKKIIKNKPLGKETSKSIKNTNN